ncbi:hypothetical protein IW01_17660 [Pectobacterium brasiliense]|uniref:hypothetical protein n=1 Tax=Pectobacterium brasiliense TaxID=180957 RepID=UPI0004E690B9|nr:hypothetical protein [Pectobacterium brasiliense]KFF67176.1 hypothetical protein IW01_17660 [Pectobacterium brasiliense]GLY60817.1 hypothetical protein Pcaca05_16740 [Pectobacterium carotovorum subsp. carotovorum]
MIHIDKLTQHNFDCDNNLSKNEKKNFHEKVLQYAYENNLNGSKNEFLEKLSLYSISEEKEDLPIYNNKLIAVENNIPSSLEEKEAACLSIFLNVFMARMLQPDYLLSYDDD